LNAKIKEIATKKKKRDLYYFKEKINKLTAKKTQKEINIKRQDNLGNIKCIFYFILAKTFYFF
jgi:hypothetical protein